MLILKKFHQTRKKPQNEFKMMRRIRKDQKTGFENSNLKLRKVVKKVVKVFGLYLLCVEGGSEKEGRRSGDAT